MTEPRKIKFHPQVADQFKPRPLPFEPPPDQIGDITYYLDPGHEWEPPEFLTSPGVTSAWFLLDGEYVPVAIMSAGDGTANVMRTDL